jgi:formylglycine-generating enzyme required for sulfatase activity
MHIFISYSSKERELVTTLADDLQALGHEVWFDRELNRTGGRKWWETILANIRQCDLFIFALTPSSLASEACRREYRYANALQKNVLPIMLAVVDIPSLPAELQELQFVNYMERTNKQALALAGTLNGLPPAHPLPVPLPEQPEPPLSPLGRIAAALESDRLTSTEQIELVFELEGLFKTPTSRASAETLLRTLHNRDDTTRSVADKIRELIPDISRQQPIRPSANSSGKPAANIPIRGLAVVAVVLVVVVLGGLVLSNLGNSARPTAQSSPTATVAVASNPTTTPAIAVASATPIPSTATPIPATAAPIPATATPLPPTATQVPATVTPFVPLTTNGVTTVTANAQWTPQFKSFGGVDMALVPPGCFMMGSTDSNNGKPNTQCLDSFWIDKYLVTNEQFASLGGTAAFRSQWTGPKRPREIITWSEARAFCQKRDARLPTEAEWEYAARGPDDLTYPWGNDFADDKAVYSGNSGSQTADVGSKPAGVAWVGALDMAGNVWEWTSSNFIPYPYDANDGRENSALTNPDEYRVLRGGSWYFASTSLRSANRNFDPPTNQSSEYGFRCARTS